MGTDTVRATGKTGIPDPPLGNSGYGQKHFPC